MAKLLCVPFDERGNMMSWSNTTLTDEETQKVYDGEKVVTCSWKNVIWRPNGEFDLHLKYCCFGRGKSSVTFYWKDEEGHEYPMFIKDMDELLRLDMGTSSIHAIFTYVKRGANYGIKFLRKADDDQND